MAQRISIPSKSVALKVIGPLGDYLAARIQRFDVPQNFPSTDINELGNPYIAGTVTDIPEITATFQAMDVSVKLFAALSGTDVGAWPVDGVNIDALGEVDLVGLIRDESVADFAKTLHVRKARVTGFTYTYGVNAESTEEYTVSATEKRWFRYDIVVDTFNAGAGSPQSLTHTPIRLKNGNYCISVLLDGEYLTEVSGAPASGEYSYSGGQISFADTVTSKLVVVYHADPAGENWANILDNTIPSAIRGRHIPVKIAANSVPRVQSVTIRGTFPNTVIKEMGNSSVVGTIIQTPQVTGDITVLDTDLSLISLLTTGSYTIPSGVYEFQGCEFTASGISILIKLYNPSSGCAESLSDSDVMKTLYIPQITITSEGHTTNVNDNATQTFGWKSTDGRLLVFSGAYNP